ncbi:MAG: cytochrome c3 family protein [Gemmatimonadales bacterium]
MSGPVTGLRTGSARRSLLVGALLVGGALLALAAGSGAIAAQGRQPAGFDHPKHSKLFPQCETCHVGAADPAASIWPTAQSCEACHDGTVQKRVDWAPRQGPPPSNLRYDHGRHRTAAATAATRRQAEAPAICTDCHQPDGGRWMTVQRAAAARCLDCHGQRAEHFAVADTACATCHLPLAEAKNLPDDRIRGLAAPADHKAPGFLLTGPAGHGQRSKSTGGAGVAASCATCHAREFCISCHVNAPETPAIQALGPDRRSLLVPAKLTSPATHQAIDFGRSHAAEAGKKGEACVTCHTRESCAACHVGAPATAIRSLYAAAEGRAVGALVDRKKPASHSVQFTNDHAALATSQERSCATCHVRTQCLECHRPDPGRASGYHPAGFLARHPAAAYARETSCSDCHNSQQFCASCHVQAGFQARTTLGQGNYHDGKRAFLFGHGQAARQSLESCVSCHAERDCLPCHSAQGGRRFNPHGPGFDPARLRRKNPEMCTACHGKEIPGVTAAIGRIR